ncbi:MAG: DnaJ domain-containing protein [Eubacterium sp.]|nr:DnaJ domain-containing protein [Eubacterium sp.]
MENVEHRRAVSILGLNESFTGDELKRQYKLYARKFHPDNKLTGNEDKFHEVQKAYEFLQDNQDKQDTVNQSREEGKNICPMCNGAGKRREKIKTSRGYIARKVKCMYCEGTGLKKQTGDGTWEINF